MKTPAPADLHRWSEELARNPGSLAFLPLARAYRRLSRRDLALQLCLRGLEHHPTHVEAHALLALLYFEAGERARAADEWATVLRLKPGNFEALRGMGFRYLEQGDIAKARHHLERAALIRPDDATVQEALRLIRQRETAISSRPAQPAIIEFEPWTAAPAQPTPQSQPQPPPQPAPSADQRAAPAPWQARTAEPRFMDASTPRAAPASPAGASPNAARPAAPAKPAPQTPAPAARPAARAGEPTQAPAVRQVPATARPAAGPQPVDRAPVPHREPPRETPTVTTAPTALGDPVRVFETMKDGPLLGVLLLDRRGLVLAGTIGPDGGSADELGAILGGAIDEAVRTATHLTLGSWRGLLLECESATLQVAPIGTEALVVVAARRDAPAGWLLRTAAHATSLAERFVGVLS